MWETNASTLNCTGGSANTTRQQKTQKEDTYKSRPARGAEEGEYIHPLFEMPNEVKPRQLKNGFKWRTGSRGRGMAPIISYQPCLSDRPIGQEKTHKVIDDAGGSTSALCLKSQFS